MKKSISSNPALLELIKKLRSKAHEEDAPVWKELARRLSRSASGRAEVNLSRIARYSRDKELVAVPGRVLGSGRISKPVVVAAFGFSDAARQKISSAGGECLSIGELVARSPKGSGVRIME